jgi:hypothetical protein
MEPINEFQQQREKKKSTIPRYLKNKITSFRSRDDCPIMRQYPNNFPSKNKKIINSDLSRI